MNKRLTSVLAIFITVILAAPVFAAGNANNPSAAQGKVSVEAGSTVTAADTNIDPAQLEMVRKREAARKRRDDLLKLRQQNIQRATIGNPTVNTVQ